MKSPVIPVGYVSGGFSSCWPVKCAPMLPAGGLYVFTSSRVTIYAYDIYLGTVIMSFAFAGGGHHPGNRFAGGVLG